MSSDWYSVDEIKRWTEADSRGFGGHAEWLAAQLNAAYHKGRQHTDELLRQAIMALNTDRHEFSTRPCPTCGTITAVFGSPFGCDFQRERQEAMQRTIGGPR